MPFLLQLLFMVYVIYTCSLFFKLCLFSSLSQTLKFWVTQAQASDLLCCELIHGKYSNESMATMVICIFSHRSVLVAWRLCCMNCRYHFIRQYPSPALNVQKVPHPQYAKTLNPDFTHYHIYNIFQRFTSYRKHLFLLAAPAKTHNLIIDYPHLFHNLIFQPALVTLPSKSRCSFS